MPVVRPALTILALSLPLLAMTAGPKHAAPPDDPYAWLEAIDASASMDWVHVQNAIATEELQSDPAFARLDARLLAIFDSKDRIPGITKIGDRYYNFWRDADHERGIMRRTTLEEYRKAVPAWETVLDVDALARREGENWLWKGWQCRYPDYGRCLVSLSRGGGDAVVVREYDIVAQRFVPASEGGFVLAEAKSHVAWSDDDHVFVGTDFGPGSMTTSGYPRIVKRWARGTPLADATALSEGRETDVSMSARRWHTRVGDDVTFRATVDRNITFYTGETSLVAEDGRLARLDFPEDASYQLWRDQILLTLRSAWTAGTHGSERSYPSGALLAMRFDDFVAGSRDFTTLFGPGPRKALAATAATRDTLLVQESLDLRNHVVQWTQRDGRWTSRVIDFPEEGTIALQPVDPDAGDDLFVYLSDALRPTTLALMHAGSDAREPLKAMPAFFETSGMALARHDAVSRDGTKVPYSVALPKGFVADGTAPTILYGYGGFEIPMLPRAYAAANGAGWLEQGGVYVVAGIRGGGEFGPDWHNAAIKTNKQRSYDDLIAVAEDLVARRITSPAHLGIMGGSNGGLLVGAVAVQRPDLFRAVVCQVPLLDMRRYNRLLAGASWMGEYGDPDVPAEWAYISRYSPYQNVVAGKRYPRFLFETSTRDDRVHPGHARKMAAKMLAQGHDVLYYENTEGGHAGAANNRQQARMSALGYVFMMRELR